MKIIGIKLENGEYKTFHIDTPLSVIFSSIKRLDVETIIFAETDDQTRKPLWEKNFTGGAIDFALEKRLKNV